MNHAPPRLYAILDHDLTTARGLRPLELAADWLDAGVRLIQLRAKTLTFGPLTDEAAALVALARPYRVPVVINDRADAARMAGADGVHVGQGDLSPADVRALLGVGAIVGLSTHSVEQLRRAPRELLSYLAIGPVFQTGTKERPDAIVGLEGTRAASQVARALGLPLVAIGGITLERASSVFDAGADSVAVVSDLLQGDPRARIRAWLDATA